MGKLEGSRSRALKEAPLANVENSSLLLTQATISKAQGDAHTVCICVSVCGGGGDISPLVLGVSPCPNILIFCVKI